MSAQGVRPPPALPSTWATPPVASSRFPACDAEAMRRRPRTERPTIKRHWVRPFPERRIELETLTAHSAEFILARHVTVPGKLDFDCNRWWAFCGNVLLEYCEV